MQSVRQRPQRQSIFCLEADHPLLSFLLRATFPPHLSSALSRFTNTEMLLTGVNTSQLVSYLWHGEADGWITTLLLLVCYGASTMKTISGWIYLDSLVRCILPSSFKTREPLPAFIHTESLVLTLFPSLSLLVSSSRWLTSLRMTPTARYQTVSELESSLFAYQKSPSTPSSFAAFTRSATVLPLPSLPLCRRQSTPVQRRRMLTVSSIGIWEEQARGSGRNRPLAHSTRRQYWCCRLPLCVHPPPHSINVLTRSFQSNSIP
jgi:hypothetical protein